MGPGLFEITTNSPSHSGLTANRCPMCMRFRNSCCYFGLGDFLTPKFGIPSGGEELDASCTCHPERPLEPRWRGESKSRDLLSARPGLNGCARAVMAKATAGLSTPGRNSRASSSTPLKMTIVNLAFPSPLRMTSRGFEVLPRFELPQLEFRQRGRAPEPS